MSAEDDVSIILSITLVRSVTPGWHIVQQFRPPDSDAKITPVTHKNMTSVTAHARTHACTRLTTQQGTSSNRKIADFSHTASNC